MNPDGGAIGHDGHPKQARESDPPFLHQTSHPGPWSFTRRLTDSEDEAWIEDDIIPIWHML
jgi:hypothetical protein